MHAAYLAKANDPAGQATGSAFGVAQLWPTGQSLQIVVLPSIILYYPEAHVGLLTATSMAFMIRQLFPSGHSLHSMEPAREYFPLEHSTGSLLGSGQ